MFLNFDHRVVDFEDEEWEEISRTDKVIIRSWFLHSGDNDQAALAEYYETDRSVRDAVKNYGLIDRIRNVNYLASFSFSHPSLVIRAT